MNLKHFIIVSRGCIVNLSWSIQQRNSSMSSGVVRRASLAVHRRATRAVLARGRAAAAPPAPAHRWAAAAPSAPARCDHCQDLLWGPLKVYRQLLLDHYI